MAKVRFEHIYKRYGQQTIVKDFNLEIKDKEFLVFVGPSGCGKSTTLRMVAGLEEISEGNLYIDDRLVNHLPPKERDVAMVFQNYALYPHMNVYENMAFGLKLRNVPKEEIDRRVREAARILQIEHLLERKPKALSGGQRQRVAMGRAIVREPKVFLMDEPLSNLDAKLRVQMRTEIIKLHRRLESTIIYVTHDQTEAMTMGDRIVVMKDGVIQQVDTPLNLYHHPCNKFVAGFIGSPAMNFLECTVKLEGETVSLNFGNFELAVPQGKGEKLQKYINQRIIFGIRPEDIHDEAVVLEAYPHSQVEAVIDVVELMGAETYLYLSADTHNFTARLDGRSQYRAGEKVRLAIDMNKMHAFDKETEEAIL
ncbi:MULTISPECIES: ABC transporter ATP-binding protein [Carboxydocella]|uniref:Carbohydrate ABC transporter ATP-binding protein, CUT1 family (TC 3.A.1.1.-) n=2 Tax=Carboxydocella TaxID=178898 RepID=A0A1T4P2X3_9FIRM|nr:MULTISPECIES: sn-glycerol-3-phosphate ABC transporter ATP-binding protein UgpC [Carboxydocella]AVX19565.1 carbohydrate ABC transporter ATP-binding protein, CUT1 family [Carboxydocella thermautotrophica]GAW29439.1 ABC transporter ATP-binding protein [Carboxydocella sp. ULO1]SJZ85853.1 carbohydrate ABC transporter ATP-binding protein, CUT1 family (TC 3.A.1.1.-) [Carboxydocella sporoproducens DSM 16521]